PKPPRLPGPDSPVYQEYAEAFQIGTAGLDAGRDPLARVRLTAAIEAIPEEPAAWANRGLLSLRNNRLDEAESDLKKAHQLAPDSPEIEILLGWLRSEERRVGKE